MLEFKKDNILVKQRRDGLKRIEMIIGLCSNVRAKVNTRKLLKQIYVRKEVLLNLESTSFNII